MLLPEHPRDGWPQNPSTRGAFVGRSGEGDLVHHCGLPASWTQSTRAPGTVAADRGVHRTPCRDWAVVDPCLFGDARSLSRFNQFSSTKRVQEGDRRLETLAGDTARHSVAI